MTGDLLAGVQVGLLQQTFIGCDVSPTSRLGAGMLAGCSPLPFTRFSDPEYPFSAPSSISAAISPNLSPKGREAVVGPPGATDGTRMSKGSWGTQGKGRGHLREGTVEQGRLS